MEQAITIINREISDHEQYLSFYKSKGNKQGQWEEERIIAVLKGVIKRIEFDLSRKEANHV